MATYSVPSSSRGYPSSAGGIGGDGVLHVESSGGGGGGSAGVYASGTTVPYEVQYNINPHNFENDRVMINNKDGYWEWSPYNNTAVRLDIHTTKQSTKEKMIATLPHR